MEIGGRIACIALLIWVAFFSWGVREANHLRMNYPVIGQDAVKPGWFSIDPDGLYHLRRLERTHVEGWPVAERDTAMNYPEGANIPWPPYYTYFLNAFLGPLAPEDEAQRREFFERSASKIPLILGILTSLLVALAARRIGGAHAGWLAGTYHALTFGSVHYSIPGLVDHHAWVALLAGAMFWLLSEALQGDGWTSSKSALGFGAAIGLLAGLNLGSWVASLIFLLEVQLVLAVLLFENARRPLLRLPEFGMALHGAALLALFPAVWTSPWKADFPWMVVNLSWFHLWYLVLGFLIFLPFRWLSVQSIWWRRYPLVVSGGLLFLGAVLFLIGVGPAAGIREGFAWVSRADRFMAGIAESEPLIGGNPQLPGAFEWMGFGILLVPVVWGCGVWHFIRKRERTFLPWLVFLPLLFVQALLQRRFADVLAVPMAVVLAWGIVQMPIFLRLPRRSKLPLSLFVALLLQGPSLLSTYDRLAHRSAEPTSTANWLNGAYRLEHEWLREFTSPGDYAVLSDWDQGHALEWVAQRNSVATNFGSYIGVDGFRAPAKVFTARDFHEAETILLRHKVRYVQTLSKFCQNYPLLLNTASAGEGSGTPLPRWKDSLLRLLMPIEGNYLPEGRSEPIPYLRLLHVSAFLDPTPRVRLGSSRSVPAGWVWEYVQGADLQAQGTPGDVLQIRLQIDFPTGTTYVYEAQATAGQEGEARLRVPYATDVPAGEGVVRNAQWKFGGREGSLRIPESAVQEGLAVRVGS